MSSGGQQPAQTTQTSDPWSGVQPYLGSLYGAAGGTYASDTGYQPYPGNLQAPLDPTLQQGLQAQLNTANSQLGNVPGVAAAQNLGTGMIQNEGLSSQLKQLLQQQQGQNNPYLQTILDTQNRQIGDRVNAAMSGAGRYGSGAHTDVMARALSEAQAPLLAQDYTRRQQMQQDILQGGLQRAGQWSQLMPTLAEAQYMPAEKIQEVGQFYQNRGAQDLANQVAVWNAQQARPWEQLSRYQNILSGAGGLGGTKVTTQNPYQPSTLARVGGGALAGAGLGSMFGPLGAGVGAAGGGLLGLM